LVLVFSKAVMPTSIVLAILGAALLHASWNALAKGRTGSDPLIGAALIAVGCAVVAVPLLVVAGWPSAASTWYVVASGLIHVAYFLLVGLSYRFADLSAVYPLMRGGAPLLTTLGGAWLIAEPATGLLLLGVVLLSAGVLGLGANALMRGGLDRRGMAVAALNIGVIVTYTLIDGVGARVSANPIGYLAAMMLITGIVLAPIAARLRPGVFVAEARRRWRIGLGGGAMAMASYGIAVWAMTKVSIGAVAALRETSVLFGTVIAAVVLKERFGVARWIAAAAITAGLVLIKLA
jgi:drug/metabolite transporter (DMT)-like permease